MDDSRRAEIEKAAQASAAGAPPLTPEQFAALQQILASADRTAS